MLINIALDWISQQEIKEKISRKMDSSDFYVENGNLVFTEDYHRNRGYCCGNNCRHCPYEPKWKKGSIKTK